MKQGIGNGSVMLLLAAACFLVGWLGQRAPGFGPDMTLTWLPSGIALAALLRWGLWCWPGIALGAFALDLALGAPWSAALALATGSVLGPLLAALALRRMGLHPAIDRARDVLQLVAAAGLGMLVPATIGVTTLALGGHLPEGRATAWLTWWATEVTGVIAAAPLVLTCGPQAVRRFLLRRGEFLAWAALTLAVTWGVFVANPGAGGEAFAVAFLPLPMVAWAALRFGAPGTALAVFLLVVGAAYGTAAGTGPFYRASPFEGAMLVWMYVATSAVLGWLITAVHIAERRATEMHRLLEQALSDISMGILLADADRRITYVSAGFTRLTGYTAADLLGRSCLILQGPGTDPEALQRLNDALHGAGHFDGDILNYRKDGTPFWNALLISPVRDERGTRIGFAGIQRDVTARVAAEIALRDSRSRLDGILNSINDVIWSTTPDGRQLLFLSASAQKLYGRPVAEFEADPLAWLAAIHADDRAVVEDAFHRVTQTGRFDQDYRIVRADGAVRWVHDRGRLLLDAGGQPIRLDGIMTDITERTRVEARDASERAALELVASGAPLNDVLVELAKGYEAVFPGMLCSVLLLDADGRHLRHGAAPGLPPAYCKAIDGMAIGPGAGSCGTAAHTRRPVVVADIAADPLWGDFRELALAHGLRACWSVPVIASNDRVLGVFAIYAREPRAATPEEILDLERGARLAGLAAERLELLDALRESQRRLETLVANLPGMAYRCRNDADWTMTYVSDGCEAITGYRREELEGNRVIAYGQLVHAEDREWLWAKCQASLEACTPCQNEYRIVDRHGRERWVSERAAGVYDAAGALLSIDGFIQDVTASRQAKLDRERLQQQMVASQRLESLGTLAGGIAHEFNNLLTVILGHAELARRDAAADRRESQSLRAIRTAGQQARDIVQQILAFSRQQPSEHRPTSLVASVQEAVGMLRSTLAPSTALDCDLAVDTPNVLADPMQLKQVVMNLCINAAQAMAGGSGTITLRTGAVTLPATGAPLNVELQPGTYARISVSDSGHGMDAATVSRIFEPFFTTKPVGEGTGLGLSMVHGIVQAHGGAVTVQSAPGQGSTFDVYLPAAHQQLVVPAEVPPAASDAAHGRRILFVDDQPWLLPLTERLLEDEGYRVSSFSDPRAALDFFQADPARIDLLVTDYRMPGMSGVELAQAARALRADLPVILLSGAATKSVNAEAMAAGINEFVYKPGIVEELCPAIARLLRPG